MSKKDPFRKGFDSPFKGPKKPQQKDEFSPMSKELRKVQHAKKTAELKYPGKKDSK